jgi:hypothetical protein
MYMDPAAARSQTTLNVMISALHCSLSRARLWPWSRCRQVLASRLVRRGRRPLRSQVGAALVSSRSSKVEAQFELHREADTERALGSSSTRHMSSSERWRGRLERKSCSTPGSASRFSCFWLRYSQVSTSRLRTSCALSSHGADRPDRRLRPVDDCRLRAVESSPGRTVPRLSDGGRGRLAWHVSVLQCAFIP